MSHALARVREEDLADLLPLVRAYCDFYGAGPSDEDLIVLSRALIADPERDGLQLLARDAGGRAEGFATVYWTWDTLGARRIGVMYDLFVAPGARGSGLADALVGACADECRARGIGELTWETAPANSRAQAVYDRMGAARSEWIAYSLEVR